MRVAVDARPLSRPLTGIGRYTWSLLTEMIPLGHEWFLYSDSPLLVNSIEFPNVTVRNGNDSPSSISGIYYSQVRYRSWIRHDGVDLFWSPRHHLPLRLEDRVAQVVTIHDVLWKRFPETMLWPARLLESVLMPASIEQADKIVCVSQFTASEIGKYWPQHRDKCTVILSAASGLDEMKGRGAGEYAPYILFVGTLEPRKNLHRLLEAFAKLVREGSISENLVVAGGTGWGNVNLALLVKDLDIEHRVCLKGYVDDAQLRQLYAGARCLVLPSLYEGFGLPVLEAMQFGVPVVVSDAGSLPEIAGSAGLLVDPMSVESIAGALELLMTNSELHSQLSARSKVRSAEYSWQTAAPQMVDLFCELAV